MDFKRERHSRRSDACGGGSKQRHEESTNLSSKRDADGRQTSRKELAASLLDGIRGALGRSCEGTSKAKLQKGEMCTKPAVNSGRLELIPAGTKV